MEKNEEDLRLITELLIHKGYIHNYAHISGLLIDKGYSMNLGDYFNQENPSFNEKISVLQNIGKVLEKLNYLRNKEHKLEDFFIGDLHEGNILVDKDSKRVQFVDLDSCKIGDNFPFLTKYLQFPCIFSYVLSLNKKYPFIGDTATPNHNTELFCYSVIVLKYLFHTNILFSDLNNFYEKIYSLKKQGLPEPLFQIFIGLYNSYPNKNPYQYLDKIPTSFERRRIL